MGPSSRTRVLLLEGFARQVMPMMEALKRDGCHVTTYNTSKLDLGYASRYPDRRLLEFWDRSDEKASFMALFEVLKSGEYDVVIPLTDFSATLLSRQKQVLSEFSRIAANDWDVFQLASDKQRTMEVCMRERIACPATALDADTIAAVLGSGVSFPLVLKPRAGHGAIGFNVIRSEKQLREYFPALKGEHGGLVAQEYIPQNGVQYQVEVFIDRAGAVKSACVCDKTRWFPVDGGAATCSTTVDRPDIAETAIKLLRAIGWRGYAEIDLIEDRRDGIVKVMEINPRITANVKMCFRAGVNFARQIVENEMGAEVTEYRSYAKGVRLRCMHTDVLWFFASPGRWDANPSWFDFRRTTDQIFSLSDPWPWITYSLQALRKWRTEMRKRERIPA